MAGGIWECCPRLHVHACLHTYMRACRYTYIYACTHTPTLTRIHAQCSGPLMRSGATGRRSPPDTHSLGDPCVELPSLQAPSTSTTQEEPVCNTAVDPSQCRRQAVCSSKDPVRNGYDANITTAPTSTLSPVGEFESKYLADRCVWLCKSATTYMCECVCVCVCVCVCTCMHTICFCIWQT